MESYRNSFSSLSDLSRMFEAEDRKPPTISYLFDRHQPPLEHHHHHHHHLIGGGTNKERERRGKMANMYSVLQSFLPNLASNKQASREKIVTEAIELIKRLEADKATLEQRLMNTKASASAVDVVKVSASSVVAFEIKWRRGDRDRMVKLVEVFERYGAEILTASVVVANDDGSVVTTTTTAAIVDGDRNGVVERIKRDLLSQDEVPGCIRSYLPYCQRAD